MEQVTRNPTSDAFGAATVGILSGVFFERDRGIRVFDKHKSKKHDQEEATLRKRIGLTEGRAKIKTKPRSTGMDEIHRSPRRMYCTTQPRELTWPILCRMSGEEIEDAALTRREESHHTRLRVLIALSVEA